jgi:carbonic anhydrase
MTVPSSASDRGLGDLFARNRAWAAAVQQREPDFFQRLAKQQNPRYLWIGCSDSRVPANEIVGLLPGEMFVHRNVGNIVVHTDLNCLSVLQYAVDVLEVDHVMVVGHYGCGGVRAAWDARPLGLIDNWLRHVQDVATTHAEELRGLANTPALYDRLCELNVVEQAVHVCRTTILQDAWRRGRDVTVHTWVYGLRDGLLRDLGFAAAAPEQVAGHYTRAVARDFTPGPD